MNIMQDYLWFTGKFPKRERKKHFCAKQNRREKSIFNDNGNVINIEELLIIF